MPIERFEHRFVTSAPRELEDGILYVSMEFGTALHLCACGCGARVVTPFSPTDWRVTYDGQSVSLHPSIGNWSMPCRSHYFIRNNRVAWAGDWTNEQIQAGRHADRTRKRPLRTKPTPAEPVVERPKTTKQLSWLQRLKRYFTGS